MLDEEKNETQPGGENTPQPPAEGVTATAEAPRNPNMKWYIYNTKCGFGRTVK
jgi:hypothetical protein